MSLCMASDFFVFKLLDIQEWHAHGDFGKNSYACSCYRISELVQKHDGWFNPKALKSFLCMGNLWRFFSSLTIDYCLDTFLVVQCKANLSLTP